MNKAHLHCMRCSIVSIIFMHYLQNERRVVSDIQARAEGELLYIWYNTDADVVNGLKNERYYLFICEVIFKINVV